MSSRTVVLVATDFSELAERALHHAVRYARGLESAQLYVLSVAAREMTLLPPELSAAPTESFVTAAMATLEEYLHRELSALPPSITVIPEVRVGEPAELILGLAHETGASLIALGTHGRRGLQRLVYGSVAERVLREAPCAVLVARDAAPTGHR